MMTMIARTVLSLILLCSSAWPKVAAFAPHQKTTRNRESSTAGASSCCPTTTTCSSSSTRLFMWFPNEGIEASRGSFPLWLFGATGSGGIARQAIPDLWDDLKSIQKLKGVKPTLGGPTLRLNPLLGYPGDLCIADVQQVVNNKLSIEQIVERYPVPNNFLSAQGYLTLSAFQEANAKANPLAVRAVFDSFQKNKVVEPSLAQSLIDQYKDDVLKVSANLTIGRGTTYTAALALLFLLGLADLATATDAYRGWFPDWPGGQDFPFQLFTLEGNPFTIPNYWIGDLPDLPE
jgi:hypothetical protein